MVVNELVSINKAGLVYIYADGTLEVNTIQNAPIYVYPNGKLVFTSQTLAQSSIINSLSVPGLEVHGVLVNLQEFVLSATENVLLGVEGSTQGQLPGVYVFDTVSLVIDHDRQWRA